MLKTCTLPEPSPVIEATSIPAPTFVNSNARSSPKPPLLVLQSMPVELPDPLHIHLDREISGAVGMNRYYSLLNIALFFRSETSTPSFASMHLSPMGKPGVEDLHLLPLTYPSGHPLGPFRGRASRHDTPYVDSLPATYSCVAHDYATTYVACY